MGDELALNPAEFEVLVKRVLDDEGVGLARYESQHQHTLAAHDGTYEFDVTACFEALGADFLVLVECKRWKSPVKRCEVQTLHSKMGSVGAQKAMLFATSGFQRGAIGYAQQHGIALVEVCDGRVLYKTKSMRGSTQYPDWVPTHAAVLLLMTADDNVRHSVLGENGPPGRASCSGFLLSYMREGRDR